MFSYLCKSCGNPLLGPLVLTHDCNEWMGDAVAVTPAHQVLLGRWELDGQPASYTGPSAAAPDQGVFFPAGLYDRRDPRHHPPAQGRCTGQRGGHDPVPPHRPAEAGQSADRR
jgi:hypothetical protein